MGSQQCRRVSLLTALSVVSRESETQETNASPFGSPAPTSRGSSKVWALSSGDLSVFASSARLRFQTRRAGLSKRETGLFIR